MTSKVMLTTTHAHIVEPQPLSSTQKKKNRIKLSYFCSKMSEPNSMLSKVSLRLVKIGSSQSMPSKELPHFLVLLLPYIYKESKKFELSRKKLDSTWYSTRFLLLFTYQKRLGQWFIKDLWFFPTWEMYIYMHITVCLLPLQNSRIHIMVLCKGINGSLNRLFFIQRITIYTGSSIL